MIKMFLVGNVGNDAVLKELSDKKKVINFSVAHDDSYTSKEGVKNQRTIWVECNLFVNNGSGRVAEFIKKGKTVSIIGKPSYDTWINKEGEQQGKLKCIVEELSFESGQTKTKTE